MAPSKIKRNLIYINQQIITLLKNTSNTVKCIWLIIFISYALSFFEAAIDIVSVTPGYIVPPTFRIWSAFTFCFLETHFWNVIIDIVMTGLCGKVIEPLWGPIEILSFFAIVNVGVAVFSSAFYLFVFVCTSKADVLFDVHIHGLSGYIAGITVAVKQIMPDILIVKTPTGRITNRNMPLLTIFFTLVFWLIGLSESVNIIMVIFGVFISWIYLRFYQKHASGTIGDFSESFNFSSFFPNILQPYVAILANITYDLLVKIKLCRKRITQSESSTELSSITVTGFNAQDKERRKQKALKALSEHLNKHEGPRIVGTVLPQRTKPQSPKKKTDALLSFSENTSAFTSSNETFASNDQKEHSVINT